MSDGGGELHQQLKNLCVNTNWKYAVLWKLDHQAKMMLSCEDAYCNNNEKQYHSGNDWFDNINDNFKDERFSQDLKLTIAKMSYCVYSVGEGIIRQVAATGNHLWISGDHIVNSSCSLNKHFDGWKTQFTAGIRTVIVVDVVPYGVVQLGSLNTIVEDLKLVNHIREIFLDLQSSLRACSPCVTDLSTNHQESVNSIPYFVQSALCNDQNQNFFTPMFSNSKTLNNPETDTSESFNFPAGCELYEALGPAFCKQKNSFSWENVTTETVTVSQMPQETSNNSLMTRISGSENLLEAVVAKSAKPRHRDRQLIQDCIKELRQLVPNGSKCSIGSLLERSIKHMLFMQYSRKHADKIEKCKLLDNKTGIKRPSSYEQGTSWAMDLGNDLKLCPIIVENNGIDGQLILL